MFTKHSPGPFRSRVTPLSTEILDMHGKHIADVLPDNDCPEREQANERLLRMAPVMLTTLRMAAACLATDIDHKGLFRHIERILEIVEPDALAQLELLKSA